MAMKEQGIDTRKRDFSKDIRFFLASELNRALKVAAGKMGTAS